MAAVRQWWVPPVRTQCAACSKIYAGDPIYAEDLHVVGGTPDGFHLGEEISERKKEKTMLSIFHEARPSKSLNYMMGREIPTGTPMGDGKLPPPVENSDIKQGGRL